MRRLSAAPLGLITLFGLVSLSVLLQISPTVAVRYHDFKKCSDSSFCRRLRRLSSYASETANFQSPYSISRVSFDDKTSTLTAPVQSALHPGIEFEAQFSFHQDGSTRIKMDQVGQRYGGWKRYDEAGKWAYDRVPTPADKSNVKVKESGDKVVVTFGKAGQNEAIIHFNPLKVVVAVNGQEQVVLNERGLLHMEHFRAKPEKESQQLDSSDEKEEQTPENALVFQKRKVLAEAGHSSTLASMWSGFEVPDSGEWEETWSSKTDSKPKGPEALSLDISFPGKKYLFGLPEHASPLNLRDTRGQKEGDFTDPYRLMNTDVFEYDYDSPMALYGSVPVVHAQSANSAVSAFFLSASETWIDIDRSGDDAHTHWMAESGILDVLLLLDDTPAKNIARFTEYTGRSTAPQTFALGYHQCRWNYLSDSDVLNVQAKFDEEDIPMDVMWLDIEYAKDHMYGVWDELNFPNPEKMVSGLDERGRKLVIIIDPHLKRTPSYWLYDEAQKNQVLVKSNDGKGEYEGWCWSGSASWLDMFNPLATEWWRKQFVIDQKNKGKIRANARNVHIWNDMNEPAIFNGPEITSPKDVIHHGGWEHRDIHNINGILFQAATFEGLKHREGSDLSLTRRPFVLSRAWWVGTQKYGAIWTGDNLGTWEHLAVSVPMILANNIAGMSFCGADIGGFFGNPSSEMLVRWYQAGIFEPFFRAHAHIDTKRREPYLLEEPYRSYVRELIRLRYKMLPIWVTAFREASTEGNGLPVLRPQFLKFPSDEQGFTIDDQYYIGDSGLLVKPAVQEGIEEVEVYLSDSQPYYDYFSHEVYHGSQSPFKNRTVVVPAPLNGRVPLLQQGGTILSTRERVRRSAEQAWRDPITLTITVGSQQDEENRLATGTLYLDDGQTYHFEQGAFIWRRFDLIRSDTGGYTIRSRDETGLRHSTATTELTPYNSNNEFAKSISDVRIEKIIILGLDGKKYTVSSTNKNTISHTVEEGISANAGEKQFNGKKQASKVVIKDPKVLVKDDWEIHLGVV
ncbi:unnamed protein product [Sympodiomycopsis kandeliae]